MNADGPSEASLQANFWWMSVYFALNHGTVTTPLVVASTQLDSDVAYIGSATLYIFTLLSSLFLGAPFVAYTSNKTGLLFGMLFYCVYIAGFTLAVLFNKESQSLAWLFFVGGSIAGGIAAGVLWPAQGGYFGQTATALAAATGRTREETTADLAGKFAFVYLGFEVLSKLGFSALDFLKVPAWLIGALYCMMAVLAVVMSTRIIDFPNVATTVSPLAKITAAASLWSDPIIWLLAPTNLTFGFCAAFMNGYFNKTFTQPEIGKEWVALLGAVAAATAALMARLFGYVGGKVGKIPVIIIGAACFGSIPLCLYLFRCCNGWGWSLLIFYLLQGTGRAVYESTNRAVFADFFPGAKSEGAFANCMLQSSLAFATCFFLSSALQNQGKILEVIVLSLAALTPVSICVGVVLHRQKGQQA